MNRERIAAELLKVAKDLVGADDADVSSSDWEKMSVADLIKYTKFRNGRVKKWKPGDGWMKVLENGFLDSETSESSIILAVLALAKKAGINVDSIFKTNLNEMKEWMPLTVLPKNSDSKTWNILLDDLTDVNYHSEGGKLEKLLEDKGIL